MAEYRVTNVTLDTQTGAIVGELRSRRGETVHLTFFRRHKGEPYIAKVTIERPGKGAIGPATLQRLPLGRMAAAVREFIPPAGEEKTFSFEQAAERASKALATRTGRGAQRGKAFYESLLAELPKWRAAGKSPRAEIAKREDVTPELVDVWIHRARKYHREELKAAARRKGKR